MRLPLSLCLVAAITACRSLQSPSATVYDIGDVHFPIHTASADAQRWFDRGLALTYGFNHEEAIRCFGIAAELDPECAMPHWGIGYAAGPNYNNVEMTDETARTTFEASRRAAALATGASPVERALIDALQVRYPSDALVDRPPVEAAYAEAMRAVHRAHPDDDDVAALTAEALMMLRPWKLWAPDGTPAPETAEIRTVLEPALLRWPDHPALCHLYIHAMEAGPELRAALPAARRLEQLAPGLGHLVHMPSHIYLWAGLYQDLIRVNERAVALDEIYVRHAGRENFYSLYRLHNYHFVAYGAMWTGQRAMALRAARRLVEEIPAGLAQEAIDFLDIFHATPYHVMVRFGLWQDLLAEPEPDTDLLATRAVWTYARGLAQAALGQVDEAADTLVAFRDARAAVPESRLLFNNSVAEILAVAEAVLEGELEYRRGNDERAFALLQRAVELDLSLNYDEPWGWMEPARHALGALLTERGRFTAAEQVYRANLERYPENGWALHGLAECLAELGRHAEAEQMRARFAKAWAHADVEIPGSCFCRTGG